MNNYKKIIDWLYSKGDNCSDSQKALRLYMFLKYSKEKLLSLKFDTGCNNKFGNTYII